jgi:dTDP-4-amino-4,6-dideoxygalactose transaminase
MERQLALFGGTPAVSAERPRWPIIGEEEIASVVQVLLSGSLSIVGRTGIVERFEDEVQTYFGRRHALSMSSGTAALHAACFAVGGGPGAEILTPSYTWMSAITAILHGNSVPVFCDVAPGTFHIDPEEIRRKATPRTKAVIVCHTWGIPADMDAILAAAREVGIAVIEDCSHAQGGRYKGRLLGTLGDVGCFSLQGSKAIVAGEGGVLITDDRLLYERALLPGHHDVRLAEELSLPETLPFVETGAYWKYRAVPLSMAVAHAQLRHLDEWNATRQVNVDRLEAGLRDLPFLAFPLLAEGSRRGFYGGPARYTGDLQRVSAETLRAALAAEKAPVGGPYTNWYQVPLLQDLALFGQFWPVEHANGARYTPLPAGALPHTEDLLARTLLLPVPAVPAADLMDQYVVAFHKVAGALDELAAYQARQHGQEREDRELATAGTTR